MVFPARKAALRMGLTECFGRRFARACSHFGISMGLIQDWFLLATYGVDKDKVMAGGTPANPAALVGYLVEGWR